MRGWHWLFGRCQSLSIYLSLSLSLCVCVCVCVCVCGGRVSVCCFRCVSVCLSLSPSLWQVMLRWHWLSGCYPVYSLSLSLLLSLSLSLSLSFSFPILLSHTLFACYLSFLPSITAYSNIVHQELTDLCTPTLFVTDCVFDMLHDVAHVNILFITCCVLFILS